jgi:hypothetical protein
MSRLKRKLLLALFLEVELHVLEKVTLYDIPLSFINCA